MQPFILATLVLLLSSGALAAQQPKDDALDGLDPVLLVGGKEVPGKSALSVTRGDFVYLFSTADTKAAFERDPARYEIQLGGLCAKMGKTAGGNPSDFIVHDGKIYIFGSDDCHKKFQAAPSKYLETPAAPSPHRRTPRRAAGNSSIARSPHSAAPAGSTRSRAMSSPSPGSKRVRRARPRSPPRRCGASPTACGRNAPWRCRERR